MSIFEIEIPKTSIGFTVYKSGPIAALLNGMAKRGTDSNFNIETGQNGFHDVDTNVHLIRGYFSVIVSFEVEHLVENIVTKTLMQRIETCEFFALDGIVFATGKATAAKLMAHALTIVSGYGVSAFDVNQDQMTQFTHRLTSVKTIAVTNPKDEQVRKVRMSGRIENYAEYDVVMASNHGIDSCQGLIDTPLGPMTVTVGRKGTLRLGVRRGFILTTDCLVWLWALVRDQQPAPATDNAASDLGKDPKFLRAAAGLCPDGCSSVTMSFNGQPPVTLTPDDAKRFKAKAREIERERSGS